MKKIASFATVAGLTFTTLVQAGGQCAVFARKTDTVRIAGNTTPSGDFTIEWSGYVLAQPVVMGPAGFNVRVWSEQDSVTEDKGIGITSSRFPTGGVNNGCFQYLIGQSSLAQLQQTHVALVHRAGNDSLYVNGALVQSTTSCTVYNGSGSNMSLGAFVYVSQATTNYWGAAPVALDWLRISATARYTGAFVPPAEASIVSDSATQLLLTFEGSTPWTDLSPQHCVLTPAAGVSGGTSPAISTDCNANAVPDEVEIAMVGADQNANGLLDVCECAQNPNLSICCPGDVNASRTVDGADVGILLGYWGEMLPTTPPAVDINHDGVVNGADLGMLLSHWGACP